MVKDSSVVTDVVISTATVPPTTLTITGSNPYDDQSVTQSVILVAYDMDFSLLPFLTSESYTLYVPAV